MPPDSNETELRSIDQEASLSKGKSSGVVLVPCCTWRCVPTAISGGVDIPEVHVCYLLRQISSRSQKLSHQVTTYLSDFSHIF